jgi:hypothetical protein
LADGAGGEGHQGPGVVVAGDAVALEFSASGAAVDDGPFAVAADPDGDGLHGGAAGGGVVAGGVIDVEAPEAPGAMVAMARAIGVWGDGFLTMPTDKGVIPAGLMAGTETIAHGEILRENQGIKRESWEERVGGQGARGSPRGRPTT